MTNEDEWAETTLGQWFTFVKTKVNPAEQPAETPYVGMEHIEPGRPALGRVGRAGDVTSLASTFEPGDTLFGRLRPYLRKVALADRSGISSTEVLILRPKATVEPAFLHLLASSEACIEHAVSVSAGTRMPRTSPADLSSFPVRVPPLAVQRRIVDLVSAADTHIANLETERDAARQVGAATAAATWQMSAPMRPLGELARIVTGSTPMTSQPEYWAPGEVGFLTPGDLTTISYVQKTERQVSRAGAASVRALPAGSVAVVCIGATIGKIGITTSTIVTNQQINSVVGLDQTDAEFLALCLSADRGQSSLLARAGQTALPLLNKTQFASVAVPWAPEGTRRELASVASALLLHLDRLDAEIARLKLVRTQLLNSLLSREVEIPVTYDELLAGVA